MLLVGSHPGTLPIAWIKAGALLGMAVTIYVSWWAKKNNRFSVALSLLLAGNLICFSGGLTPFLSADTRSTLVDLGFAFWVLSILARFFSLLRLLAKKH